MISQINNYNMNTSFYGAKLKAPKNILPKSNSSIRLSNIKNKITDTFTKVKSEFENMDEETKDLLVKVVVSFTLLSTVIGTVIYYVSKIVDKIKAIF